MRIVDFILAIISLIVMFFFPVISFLIGIVAVILSIIDLIKSSKSKCSKVLPIIAIILSCICICVSSIFLLFRLAKSYYDFKDDFNYIKENVNSKSIIGTWYDEKNKLNLVIKDDNTVELYTDDRTTLNIKGTYTLEQDEDNEMGDEYIITITASSRVIDGESYTSNYTTQFSLMTEDYLIMLMTNTITYNMYWFERVK